MIEKKKLTPLKSKKLTYQELKKKTNSSELILGKLFYFHVENV